MKKGGYLTENYITNQLKNGDLRTIGSVNSLITKINNQSEFDELFKGLFHDDRKVVMRVADAIEKITIENTYYLNSHKKQLIQLVESAEHKELKWHLALIIPRLKLTKSEVGKMWNMFTKWAIDAMESRIVRVNSIQALYDLQKTYKELSQDFILTLTSIEKDNIPSINARIKKLTK